MNQDISQIIVGVFLLFVSGIGIVSWYAIRKLTETVIENNRALIEFGIKLENVQKSVDKVPKIESDLNRAFDRIKNLEHVKSC